MVFGNGRQVCPFYHATGTHPYTPKLVHIRIGSEQHLCHCGEFDCLEAYVGGWAIIERLNDPAVKTLNNIKQRALDGDETVLSAINESAFTLGKQSIWPIQLMQTSRIILTGPMSQALTRSLPSFVEGLATVLGTQTATSLFPTLSANPTERMKQGGFQLCKRLFFYAEEHDFLKRSRETNSTS